LFVSITLIGEGAIVVSRVESLARKEGWLRQRWNDEQRKLKVRKVNFTKIGLEGATEAEAWHWARTDQLFPVLEHVVAAANSLARAGALYGVSG
jgi:hypothetical protein